MNEANLPASIEDRRSPSKPIPTSATIEQLVAHYNSQLPDYNKALEAFLATATSTQASSQDRALQPIDDLASVIKDDVIELIRKQNHRLKRHIRPRAEALLQQVVSTNEDGRTVGYSYADVLDILAQEFPECSTSAAALRWYVVHLWSEADDEGRPRPKMPQLRPRSVSRKALKHAA
jgi:predicted Zn-dependent protease